MSITEHNEHRPVTAETADLSYVLAVNAALRRALDEVPEVILYGEDVAKGGGIFGATRGLASAFGDRVFDTPISESAILGSALGAAMLGRRPVVEIMWIDFALVALDQIVNQIANTAYVSRGRWRAPLVIRTQQGHLPGACAQHAQNLEAMFAHTPGLRVGLPYTTQDAYDMLLSAVHCDDPVLIIENRSLYFRERVPVAVNGPVQPIGAAAVRRAGSDATVVAWSAVLAEVLAAADELSGEGIEIEVIDLRWLNPLDEATVFASVRKTSRFAVVHEANLTGGFGGELVARVAERCLGDLDAAPRRVATPDLRIPAAPHLQQAVIPQVADITASLRQLVSE
ncbi:alpha-ketoacid dehydrogenase subunit beta [Jiangella asiatica]|uniref:Acetoin dehydrogenase n=1 Tax=Jiangella asiatica TaxID=2530372 RepID=A0A4R5D4L3_9ACTN|nr:transketolase C-terminal domain-containing protein [Jiangella asiatica]TDE08246.1 acetoin dehydrogenase [Jiangella asiatica]